MGKILSVVSQKGGVGKTTTAANLAAALAGEHLKVLLVEVDPQGTLSVGVGCTPNDTEHGLGDLLREDWISTEVLRQTKVPNLHLLPATPTQRMDERELDDIARNHSRRLGLLLRQVADDFDWVLLDAPATLGPLTQAVLEASDSYLVPVQAEEMAYQTLTAMEALVARVREEANPDLTCEGLLLTMVDLRTRMAVKVINRLRENHGESVLMNMVPRTVRLQEMVERGKPAVLQSPASRGARAYREVAQEILMNQMIEASEPATATVIDAQEYLDSRPRGRGATLARDAALVDGSLLAEVLGTDDFGDDDTSIH